MHQPTLLRRALWTAFAASSAMTASGAHAQSAAPVGANASAGSTGLPEVVVRGILPNRLENLPGSSHLLSREALQERQPFSILEAMREVPGVHAVSEDAAGTHLNIGMRGLNPRRSSRTLPLEDGAPVVFFAPYGDPSSHYSTPLERLERIEVLKGSGQVLYGPQTMSGMVNYVTRPVPKSGMVGEVKLQAGNRGYWDAHLNVGAGDQRGGLMLDALKKSGDGVREGHRFALDEVALKGQLNLSATQRIIGKLSHFEENSRFSETGLTAAEYRQNRLQEPADDNGERGERFVLKRTAAQLIYEASLRDGLRFSTQFYATKVDRESRRAREFEDGDAATGTGELASDEWAIRPRRYQTYGIEPKLDIQHQLGGMSANTTLGVRYHREQIDRKKYLLSSLFSDASGDKTGDERLKVDVEAIAAYAQTTLEAGAWSFTPGLRIEDIRYNKQLFSGDALDQRDAALKYSNTVTLPGLGLTWNGLKNTTLYGGVHRGFSPPRPDRDIDGSTLHQTRPELATIAEVGLRTRMGRASRLEATLFNIDIDDLVVQGGSSGNVFRNAGRARHTGLELGWQLNLGDLTGQRSNLTWSGGYTYLMTAKFLDDGTLAGEGEDGYGSYARGNRLPYAPKHMLTMNLRYDDPSGWRVRVGMNHISRQFANTENLKGTSPEGFCDGSNTCGLFGEIPSVTLYNASLIYAPKGSKLRYVLNVDNLTDKAYFSARTNGLQPGRPRTVYAGVRYSF